MEAEALNVMCSYNGDHKKHGAGSDSCTNHRILETLLRGRLGFHGFVISDLGVCVCVCVWGGSIISCTAN